jgi:hypothetical protein
LSDTHYPALGDIDAIQQAFESAGYICTTRIATVVRLAAALEKPVLIEGPPGVGKTELAKTCAMVVDRPLVRLQCYEGLDESKALYEWKYGKQLLYTQLLKEQLGDVMDGAKGLTGIHGAAASVWRCFLFRGVFGITPAVESDGRRTRRRFAH